LQIFVQACDPIAGSRVHHELAPAVCGDDSHQHGSGGHLFDERVFEDRELPHLLRVGQTVAVRRSKRDGDPDLDRIARILREPRRSFVEPREQRVTRIRPLEHLPAVGGALLYRTTISQKTPWSSIQTVPSMTGRRFRRYVPKSVGARTLKRNSAISPDATVGAVVVAIRSSHSQSAAIPRRYGSLSSPLSPRFAGLP